MSDEVTTIKIKKSTREKLNEVGKKGDTYDVLILRLIEVYKAYIESGVIL